MHTILNIHKLSDILTKPELIRLDAGALQHKRYSNILFKIQSVNDEDIYIQTVQGKTLSNNLTGHEILVKRTIELFQPFFPGKKIEVHASPFLIPAVEVVNAAWISQKMQDTGKRIKDIVNDTGLNKSFLSAIINDSKPLSQINKAFFYYYFTR